MTTRVCQTSLSCWRHAQREFRDVEHDIGVADLGFAKLARQPAPSLHVDDQRVDDVDLRLGGVSGAHAFEFSITPSP